MTDVINGVCNGKLKYILKHHVGIGAGRIKVDGRHMNVHNSRHFCFGIATLVYFATMSPSIGPDPTISKWGVESNAVNEPSDCGNLSESIFPSSFGRQAELPRYVPSTNTVHVFTYPLLNRWVCFKFKLQRSHLCHFAGTAEDLHSSGRNALLLRLVGLHINTYFANDDPHSVLV